MDVIEYAKWGIRVKEEPVALDALHLNKEMNGGHFGELNGDWMCKFPCDAPATFNVAARSNLHYGFLEPFETSQVNHAWENNEYLNVPQSNSMLIENNINATSLEETVHTFQKDESAKNHPGFHNNLEENDLTTNVFGSREPSNIIDSANKKLNSVLNMQCETPKELADVGNQRESVECLFERTNCHKLRDVAVNVKNQEELFDCSDVNLRCDSIENVTTAANVFDERELDACLGTQNSSSVEIDSLNGNNIVPERQEEKNNSRNVGHPSFKCPDCGKILRRSSGFLTHMKLHLLQLPHTAPDKRLEHCKEVCNDRSKLSYDKKVSTYTKRSIHVASQKDETHVIANCSEQHLPNHCKESFQKETEQRRRQSNRCQEVLQLNPKRRRQSYSKECSVTKIANGNSNSLMQQEDSVDNGFDQEWSSEVKCQEKQEGQNSRSSTLSLRLFRFRRPKVVVKRSQVSACGESVTKVFNSRFKDNCSSNLSRERTLLQEESVMCVNTLNGSTSKPIVNEVKKTSKTDSNVRNGTDIHNLSQEKEHFMSSQVNSYSILCGESSEPLDSSNYSANVSKIDEVSDVLCTAASGKLISETCKQLKTRSDLKIRIKPVVVLDRLKLFENRESNKFHQRCTSKSNLNVSVDDLPNKIAINMNSNVSQKCNIEYFEDNVESSALTFEAMKQAKYDSDSVSQNSDFVTMSQYSQRKGKTTCKNVTKISVEQPIRYKELYSQCDKVYDNKPPSKSHISLEKQYCLKKCYVKLSRICVESSSFGTIERQHDKRENVNEVRTCGKLKLRRTSSKLWRVSTCNSDLENPETAEDSAICNRTTENEQMYISENSDNFSSDLTIQSQIDDQKSEKLPKGNERNYKYKSKTFPVSFHRSLIEIPNQQLLKLKPLNNFRSNCTWCQKIFFDEESLAQHLKTHMSGYKCPQCSAKFHFMMELQSHIAGCSLVRLLSCQETQFPIKHCKVIL